MTGPNKSERPNLAFLIGCVAILTSRARILFPFNQWKQRIRALIGRASRVTSKWRVEEISRKPFGINSDITKIDLFHEICFNQIGETARTVVANY